jgi:hypothetical protein
MANTYYKIQLKRGFESSLPVLQAGEPAFCTDSKKVVIGNGDGTFAQILTNATHANGAGQSSTNKTDHALYADGAGLPYLSVTGAAALTNAQFGSFIKLTGTAPYTVSIPTPVGNAGKTFEFYNNASGTVTLSIPAGQFTGVGFTAGSAYAMSVGAYAVLVSDGSNWFLSDNTLGATQSAGNNSTKIANTAYVDNVSGVGGWIATSLTYTYSAADSPTFVMTVPADVTGFIYAGCRIKLTQSTVKYFIVTAVLYSAGVTTITMYGGTDYILANSAISSVYFSNAKAPQGFPLNPIKWSVTFLSIGNYQISNPTAGWYNPGGSSLVVPVGIWNISYKTNFSMSTASPAIMFGQVTLSGNNNSETNPQWTFFACSKSSSTELDVPASCTNVEVVAVKETVYLNVSAGTPLSTLGFLGSYGETIIRAVCAYL